MENLRDRGARLRRSEQSECKQMFNIFEVVTILKGSSININDILYNYSVVFQIVYSRGIYYDLMLSNLLT